MKTSIFIQGGIMCAFYVYLLKYARDLRKERNKK